MDAATQGVMHDLTLLVWLALIIGVMAYRMLRVTLPGTYWNGTGRVEVGWCLPPDAMIVAAISMLLLSGLRVDETAAAPVAPAAETTPLSVNATLGSIVVQLGLALLLLVYLRNVRRLSPAKLFGLRQLSLGRLLGVVLLAVVPMLVVVNGSAFFMQEWLRGFWPDMSGQEAVEAFRKSTDPVAKGLMIIAAAVIAPLVEELFFRGFIYGVMKRYTDGLFAALCSSILFAVVHMHIGTLLPLALLALIFCALYERTGSLLVPMLLHAAFNSVSLVVMLFFPDAKP